MVSPLGPRRSPLSERRSIETVAKKAPLGNRRSRQRGSTVTSELLETVQHELRVEKEKELCAWERGLDWRPWEAVTPASVECGVFSLDL